MTAWATSYWNTSLRTTEPAMHQLSTHIFGFCFIALFVMGCASGSSTVTVGGKSVEMPTEVAEEHQKLIDNIGLYDDPELDA